jgi:hypothetical protein
VTGTREGAAGADPQQPLNREQRRAARFRPRSGIPDPHAVLPPQDESAARDGDDQGSFAGGRGGDVDHDTGPGTGGATESDDRPGRHEGTHLGHQPSS